MNPTPSTQRKRSTRTYRDLVQLGKVTELGRVGHATIHHRRATQEANA